MAFILAQEDLKLVSVAAGKEKYDGAQFIYNGELCVFYCLYFTDRALRLGITVAMEEISKDIQVLHLFPVIFPLIHSDQTV